MDQKLAQLLQQEQVRQEAHVELIASENYVSTAVLTLVGSVFMNKYAEGYPGKRYYSGCENIDVVENIAITTLKQMFQCQHQPGACLQANAHANVQPHSGSQANAAAYMALLEPQDTILGMALTSGGHLTHGFHLNFSGKIYQTVFYEVDKTSEQLDYDAIFALAKQHRPKIIVAGASAYARTIDFARFREICDAVGAYLLVDMAHIAGLIVAGEHENPICYADVVTTTTHKTLRGPRGGAILCRATWANAIDRAVFPGEQGGPLENIIAGKAQAFIEALQPSFKIYQQQVRKNVQAMLQVFQQHNFRIVSGGSDNHLFIIDTVASLQITGKKAADILEHIFIIANKNTIPFDQKSPQQTSGVRFGTAAMTTRGWKEAEFERIATIIVRAWQNHQVALDDPQWKVLQAEVTTLLKPFPMYQK